MDSTENHDNRTYNLIMFERETISFVLRAIEFYVSLLGDESRELAEDPDLANLITEDTRRELGLGRDKERAIRIKQWIQDESEATGGSYHVDISMSHGTVRFIKATSLLYLSKLKLKRNALASRPNVTAATLSALDREISRTEELFTSAGVFKNASPVPLLAQFEPLLQAEEPGPQESVGDDASLLTASRSRGPINGVRLD